MTKYTDDQEMLVKFCIQQRWEFVRREVLKESNLFPIGLFEKKIQEEQIGEVLAQALYSFLKSEKIDQHRNPHIKDNAVALQQLLEKHYPFLATPTVFGSPTPSFITKGRMFEQQAKPVSANKPQTIMFGGSSEGVAEAIATMIEKARKKELAELRQGQNTVISAPQLTEPGLHIGQIIAHDRPATPPIAIATKSPAHSKEDQEESPKSFQFPSPRAGRNGWAKYFEALEEEEREKQLGTFMR